jgi:hypothetical protein
VNVDVNADSLFNAQEIRTTNPLSCLFPNNIQLAENAL